MKQNLNQIIHESIVCLPVFNEEKAIEKMIDDILDLSIDLIITDGGSTDNSLKIAESKGVKILHRPNKGKGYGMIQAINYALKIKKNYIIFVDCDLTYSTEKLYDMLCEIENYDMVVGNRSFKNMSLKSKVLNYSLRIIILILFNRYIKDTVSGFRVLKIKKYLNAMKDFNMGSEIELTIHSIRNNLSVKEVTIDYNKRVGKSKLMNKDIINAFLCLLTLKFKK